MDQDWLTGDQIKTLAADKIAEIATSDIIARTMKQSGWHKLYDALSYCADERNSNGYVVARAALQEVDRMAGK